ncbi:hypothetical protein F5Y15DRAFT_348320 [Xylariaceae sp. FL0016]|nr:hypothetical protein F5Y15DRAFT_348320 [Xylariaceae sp. FL0016]
MMMILETFICCLTAAMSLDDLLAVLNPRSGVNRVGNAPISLNYALTDLVLSKSRNLEFAQAFRGLGRHLQKHPAPCYNH